MSALLRFLAALVAVSFVAACGETLPTGVDQDDSVMAGECTEDDGEVAGSPSTDSDDDDDDDDDDGDGDVGIQCGGWLGSGG